MDGLLLEVRADERTTATTAAVAAGATSIPVDDVTPFGDDGGQVDIAGTVYDYTGVDASTVTVDGEGGALLIASPLVAAVDEFTLVSELVGATVAVDFYAVVDLGQDDEASHHVEVPLVTREERLAWPAQTYDPPLPVSLSDDLERIVAAPAATPQLDSTYISNPHAMAYKSGSTNWPDNTWQTITDMVVFDSNEVDYLGSGVFQVLADGYYDCRVGVSFGASNAGTRAVRMHYETADGSINSRFVKGPGEGTTGIETAQVKRLNAGETVEFQAWQNSGAALQLIGGIGSTPTDCAILRVSP